MLCVSQCKWLHIPPAIAAAAAAAAADNDDDDDDGGVNMQEWRTLWVDEAFWHFLFEFDLLLIMFVCRPTSSSKHHR